MASGVVTFPAVDRVVSKFGICKLMSEAPIKRRKEEVVCTEEMGTTGAGNV